MNIRVILASATTLLLVSCTTVTDVVPAGKDTYIVAGEDIMEGTSGASIKTSLYKRANSYCEALGKKLLPADESVSLYSAQLRFRCLEEEDPEYVRPVMESVPDIRIETK